ncbi:MAG: hypothetical protein OER88_12485 [Planctomycetota bacterium]|nr:hypothetical protein [Planctomycetota bacterium]
MSGCAGPSEPIDPLGAIEFRSLHDALAKDETAAWETPGWRVDLAAARREAERTGRPLFVWTMNGHPLGCT